MSMEPAPRIEIHTHHAGVMTRGQPEPSRFGCGPLRAKGQAMTIKAIETRYKGYRFRSRLEARWAVLFDAMGIEWKYEPEGLELPDGTRYLPDFWLPTIRTWVEVKGNARDWDVCRLAEDKLHQITECTGVTTTLLFDIPESEHHPAGVSFIYADGSVWYGPGIVRVSNKAISAARGARFEHGESGAR